MLSLVNTGHVTDTSLPVRNKLFFSMSKMAILKLYFSGFHESILHVNVLHVYTCVSNSTS